jgi:23S rRNA U2552 (ribose-2'-O)-methylase RlmE/FtsJ
MLCALIVSKFQIERVREAIGLLDPSFTFVESIPIVTPLGAQFSGILFQIPAGSEGRARARITTSVLMRVVAGMAWDLREVPSEEEVAPSVLALLRERPDLGSLSLRIALYPKIATVGHRGPPMLDAVVASCREAPVELAPKNFSHVLTVMTSLRDTWDGKRAETSGPAFAQGAKRWVRRAWIGLYPGDLFVRVGDAPRSDCRAEGKLRELVELRGLCKVARGDKVLDIGAAPGSFSRFLARDLGASVCAVDPAEMPLVAGVPGVTHLACRIEQADLGPHGPFDLVTCDANIPPLNCIEVLVQHALPHLKREGSFAITLKLVGKKSDKEEAYQAKQALAKAIGTEPQLLHLLANTDFELVLVGTKDN